jgi:hypothetical protein
MVAILGITEVRDVIDATLDRWPKATPALLVGAVNYYAQFDAYPHSEAEALELSRIPAPLASTGSCPCDEYSSRSEAARESLSSDFGERLTSAARSGKATLFVCASCARCWQDGGGDGTLFEVPPIEPGAWLENPYADPLEWALYEEQLAQFLATADRTERDVVCRVERCGRRAIVYSVFCLDHHWANAGHPKPRGRPLRGE